MSTTLITSQASLITVAAAWLNRGSELSDDLGTMIDVAEAKLRKDPRVKNLKVLDYIVARDRLAVPGDFKTLESWYHDGPSEYGRIRIVEPSELGEHKWKYGTTGVPKVAAIINGEFRFAPAPVATVATGTLTSSSAFVATDTVTVGDVTYTFIATPAAANDVDVGATQGHSIANLVAAINDSGGGSAETYYATGTVPNPRAYAVDNGDNTVTITAKVPGLEGNAVATTTTGGTSSFGAATLAGGAEASTVYPSTMTYWQALTKLAAGTNWLVESHPDIYLYATLVEAEPYLKNKDTDWKMMLEEALELLRIDTEMDQYAGPMTVEPSTPIG